MDRTKKDIDVIITFCYHWLGSNSQPHFCWMDAIHWTDCYFHCFISYACFIKYLSGQLQFLETTKHLPISDVYIAETAHPDIRASLASLPGFGFAVGISIIWILAYFWSYIVVAYVATIPSALLLISFCFFPETPQWLIEHEQEDAAVKSLKFFRQADDDIAQEINEMQSLHFEKQETKTKSWNWTLSRLCSPAFLKPFSSIGVLFIMSTMNGNNVLANYLTVFMDEAESDIDPSVGPFVIGIIRLTVVGFVPYFVQKMSPRPSFSFGFLLKAFFMASMGTFYYFNSLDSNTAKMFNWIPLVSFILIGSVRTIALDPFYNILLSELFPSDIRTLSVGIVRSFESGVAAILAKIFPNMKATLGMSGLCYFYSVAALFTAIWAFLTIPDNRSKSLVEIEKSYGSIKK